MDREILFRGKRVDNGEWVEGFYWKDIWGDNTEYIYYDGEDYEVIPETAGQYTGRDIGKKKIFKGDILKNSTGLYIVAWDEHFLGWYVLTEKRVSSYNLNTILTDKKRPCEIVGNIHDNSELLEV